MKMVKRALAFALAAVTALAAIGLSACQEESHTHVFGEWRRVSSEGSCEGATLERKCEQCERTETRPGSYEDHVWAAEYDKDGEKHWKACVFCEETKDEGLHIENGQGLCKDCKAWLPTESVTYALSADGEYAIVTGYSEDETNVVVIAPSYDDVPVTTVGTQAFSDDNNLERIVLPNTITTIEHSAFSNCKRLMGIFLPKSVTGIGDNAFFGCEELMIFCEAESKPSGWSESWNPQEKTTVWGHAENYASPVSVKAQIIADAMLKKKNEQKKQVEVNEDLAGMKAPEGFSRLTRFDAIKDGWVNEVLWYYSYDGTNLWKYSDVWFAAKIVRGYWAFAGGPAGVDDPWVYIHIRQLEDAEDGYTHWRIEASIGGQVYVIQEDQIGGYLDQERPANSIARILWDEGFTSKDKNAILLYPIKDMSPTIYCTEVRAVEKGEKVW